MFLYSKVIAKELKKRKVQMYIEKKGANDLNERIKK
jgi:hypothetical protein